MVTPAGKGKPTVTAGLGATTAGWAGGFITMAVVGTTVVGDTCCVGGLGASLDSTIGGLLALSSSVGVASWPWLLGNGGKSDFLGRLFSLASDGCSPPSFDLERCCLVLEYLLGG